MGNGTVIDRNNDGSPAARPLVAAHQVGRTRSKGARCGARGTSTSNVRGLRGAETVSHGADRSAVAVPRNGRLVPLRLDEVDHAGLRTVPRHSGLSSELLPNVRRKLPGPERRRIRTVPHDRCVVWSRTHRCRRTTPTAQPPSRPHRHCACGELTEQYGTYASGQVLGNVRSVDPLKRLFSSEWGLACSDARR